MRQARLSFRTILLMGLLVLCTATPAGNVSAGTNVWTSIGPGGGIVFTLAIDPATPATLYAGIGRGGLFKSTDGGGNWSVANIGLTTPDILTCSRLIPKTPAALYAGTSAGVFKSTNGGGNWSTVNTGLTVTDIYTLAVDPKAPATVYAGAAAGVFKSTNGGGDWSAANAGVTGSPLVRWQSTR